jgi:hypothetical protein
MLASTAARTMLRVPLTRSLVATNARRTTHPAKAPVEQQSVGEDMQETQVKNATVPVLMAGGAVFVG